MSDEICPYKEGKINWYNNYQKILDYFDLDPQESINLDETEIEIIPIEEESEPKRDNPNPNKKTGKQTTLF
jgi:hypothetical protein